jgi:hypothetical protein
VLNQEREAEEQQSHLVRARKKVLETILLLVSYMLHPKIRKP